MRHFSKSLSVLLPAVLLLTPVPRSLADDGIVPADATPATQAVLKYFELISKFYRPSLHEGALRDELIQIAKRHGYSYQVDRVGNLLVRVPGTGKYAESKVTLAMQSHLDMVLDVDPTLLKNGQKIEDHFRGGVHLVAEQGWVHSQNHETSIGADDGIGVAAMIRYMENSKIEHPELELVFTVDEETGLTGAAGFDLPLKSKYMINLDGEDAKKLYVGSMGSRDTVLTGSFAPSAEVEPLHSFIKVSLNGFQGGHSGLDVLKGRGHASRVMAELLQRLLAIDPQMALLNFTSGTPGMLSKIPGSAEMTLAVSTRRLSALQKLIENHEPGLKKKYEKTENSSAISLTSATIADPGQKRGLNSRQSRAMADLILALPYGVAKYDPGFPDRAEATSNLAYFSVLPDGADMKMDIGVMPRGFTNESMDVTLKAIVERCQAAPFRLSHKVLLSFPVWTPPRRNLLADACLKAPSVALAGLEMESIFAGLEPAYFSEKNPTMRLISVGATIKGEHSHLETFEIASVQRLVTLVDEVIQSKDLIESCELGLH